jgi:hypothetical protein
MSPRRFFAELFVVVTAAVILACLTTPDGFSELAAHVAGLVG